MSRLQDIREVLTRHPRATLVLLDAVYVLAAFAAFDQLWAPDVLFHVIWVVLTLQAFLFGLRVTAVRIGVAMLLLLLYFNLGTLEGPNSRVAVLDLAEWPFMVAIAVIVAVMADRVANTSRRYAELYRRASDRLMTAEEDERKRLGRDLHDGVGQTLTAVVLTLDAAESMLWAGDGPPSPMARAAVQRAQALAATAMEETHDVAYRLRPDRFVETGIVAAVNRLAGSAGVPVTVVAAPELARAGVLAPGDEMNVYRVVQEALNNAVRHAHARHIRIEFGADDDVMSVAVVDDGIGLDPTTLEDRGIGFAGMRERALILRARLEITSAKAGGTTVTLTVPLPHREATSSAPSEQPPRQTGAPPLSRPVR